MGLEDAGPDDGGGASDGGGGGPDANDDLQLEPTSHDYGDVNVDSAQGFSFTLSNAGGAASATITVRIGGTNSGDFSLENDQCSGQPLGAGADCGFDVVFRPGAAGSRVGEVRIDGGPTASLSGNGVIPGPISIDPTAHDFGGVLLNMTSPAQIFTVTNTATVPSGTLTTSLSGSDAGQFSVETDTCDGQALAGGAACSVRVVMQPTSRGGLSATLSVGGTPGGTAPAALMGQGQVDATLGLMPASFNYGSHLLGATIDQTFVVSNDGDRATSALSLTLSGSGDFGILAPAGGDCVAGLALAGGDTCTVRVRYTATTRGTVASDLTVSAGSLTQTAVLSAVGQAPAQLTGEPGDQNHGTVNVGAMSTAVTFNVTNVGDVPTGVPVVMVTGVDFTIVNGCTAALGPGMSCGVTVRFAPMSAGGKSSTLTVAATPGGVVLSNLSGSALWPLTVNKVGTGALTRDGAVACSPTCPETTGHGPGAVVTLIATSTNGSGQYFGGWSGACTGVHRTCVVTMDNVKNVTATFVTIPANLIFVSSALLATNLGSPASYDAQCNALATAVGINDPAGTAFIAVISDGTSLAVNRLGMTARGWVRMDGKPFADTQTSLFANNVIFNPIRLDENGFDQTASFTMTGTNADGTNAGAHCNGWTSNSSAASFVGGTGDGGPGGWTGNLGSSCNSTWRIYCMGKTKNTPVSVSPAPGKRIFLSANHGVSAADLSPDAQCDADKPAGVGMVKAIIARSTSSASSAISMGTTYVRPDGVPVGTGADLVSLGFLRSGIWQTGNGTYPAAGLLRTWTGTSDLTALPSASMTCGDWGTSAVVAGSSTTVGYHTATSSSWWNFTSLDCTGTARFYCAEQ